MLRDFFKKETKVAAKSKQVTKFMDTVGTRHFQRILPVQRLREWPGERGVNRSQKTTQSVAPGIYF